MRTFLDRLRDTAADVAIELHARRSRSVLLLVAVALSTGALASSIGISQIAATQVDAGIAASTIDLVQVSPAHSNAEEGVTAFPDDAPARAAALDMVEAAGLRLDPGFRAARRQNAAPSEATVSGATSGYLSAAGCESQNASLLDSQLRVAFVGKTAAQSLGVPTTGDLTGVVVWVDGLSYSVLGGLDCTDAGLSNVVVIPYSLALARAGSDDTAQLLVRTAMGAGAPVASVIRLAVRPDAPQSLRVSPVVDLLDVRTGVSAEFTRLIAGTGAFLLALTALLIANSMVVSVTSRTAEIGLRRAMGASAGEIALLVLVEGAILGIAGGLAGGAVAAGTIVLVSAVNAWTAAINPVVLLVSPALGAAAGLVSSIFPAIRAAQIQPAIAIRID